MSNEKTPLNYNTILKALNHVVGYYFPFAQAEMERSIYLEGYDGGNWHIYDSMRTLQELLEQANNANQQRFETEMAEIRRGFGESEDNEEPTTVEDF